MDTPQPRLISFSALFSDAWQGVKQNARALVPFGALLFLLNTVLPQIFSFLPPQIAVLPTLITVILALALTFFVPIMMWEARREGGEMVQVLRRAMRHWFRFGAVSVFVFLVTIGALVPFIIPGFIVGVFLSLSGASVVIEGKRGVQALARSWALVSGNFWSILWRYILLFIVMIVLMLAAVIPVTVVLSVIVFSSTPTELLSSLEQGKSIFGQPYDFVLNAWEQLISIAVSFLATSFIFSLFSKLQELKPEAQGPAPRNFYLLAFWGVIAFVISLAVFSWLMIYLSRLVGEF